MTENQSNMGAVAEICYLGLHAARVTRSLVGRPIELAAVEQELTSARSGMVCITVEGEPGIGKTRFLVAVEELTRSEGFVPVAVTADEEIRGPFLVARSMFAAPSLSEIATGTRAERPMQRLIDVLPGRDIARHHGARARHRAPADAYRRHKHRVAADECAVFDDRLVLG